MPEEEKISKFNEAILKMKRLDMLQMTLNSVRINLFQKFSCGKNSSSSNYGFEIVMSSLEGLFQECCSKMKPSELTTNNELYARCNKLIYELLSKQSRINYLHKERGELKISLFEYETFLRMSLEKHGLSSPNESNPNQAITN
jgi:hypothetical protein